MTEANALNMVASNIDDSLRLSALVTDLDGVTHADDAPESGTCRICGLTGRGYAIDDVFSDAFTSANQLSAGDHICYRCEYMASAKDYRRYHWIATEEEIEFTKDREELLDTLLHPPEGRWMVQVTDGFLYVLNGWIKAQEVNVSRDTFRVLDDTDVLNVDRKRLSEMVSFARGLRNREDQVAKRVLTDGAKPSDYARYGLTRAESDRIDQYRGRADWALAVRLIQ